MPLWCVSLQFSAVLRLRVLHMQWTRKYRIIDRKWKWFQYVLRSDGMLDHLHARIIVTAITEKSISSNCNADWCLSINALDTQLNVMAFLCNIYIRIGLTGYAPFKLWIWIVSGSRIWEAIVVYLKDVNFAKTDKIPLRKLIFITYKLVRFVRFSCWIKQFFI